MSDPQINLQVLQRFGAIQNPLGRWLRLTHVRQQRVFWLWCVAGARWLKRAFDIGASLLALLFLSPLFLLIAVLVKLEDGGPVIFPQTRVGKFGRHFTMYKFRSMCLDAERRFEQVKALNHHGEGITFKVKDDPRITRMGKWLRKFSFDELPQLYNVLKGDMSLVGPRPPVPREVALYSLADRRRLAATPGITCFWQISGRANIDFSGQVMLDVRYIETQSFWVDLKIMTQTVPAVLSGKGAC